MISKSCKITIIPIITLFLSSCIDFSSNVSATDSEIIDDKSLSLQVGYILAPTRTCNQLKNTAKFKNDIESTIWNIPICTLNGALWWRADADIDYDDATSARTSYNTSLNSEEIPYFTIPYPSNGFNSTYFDIYTGKDARASVGVVIYDDKYTFAVFGNYNGNGVIGDISQKTADKLGIPNGVNGGVTYIVFTGENYVYPIEDYDEVEKLATELTKKFIAEN